jgi:GNAT superfamily N-acetyltransferase
MAATGTAADLEAIVKAIGLPESATVRAWKETDFPAIQQLFQAEGWPTPLERPDDAVEAWCRSWPALVAIHDETVIGFCRALSDGLVTTYVAELLVAPAWRRRGIASALLEATQRLCPGSRLDLLSTAAADSFYQQESFRPFPGFRLSWAERTSSKHAY